MTKTKTKYSFVDKSIKISNTRDSIIDDFSLNDSYDSDWKLIVSPKYIIIYINHSNRDFLSLEDREIIIPIESITKIKGTIRIYNKKALNGMGDDPSEDLFAYKKEYEIDDNFYDKKALKTNIETIFNSFRIKNEIKPLKPSIDFIKDDGSEVIIDFDEEFYLISDIEEFEKDKD
jgi:hypothetical protein